MNDYIVSINDKKHSLKILSADKIELDGKEYSYELSQLSKYSYLLKVDDKIYQFTSEKINSQTYNFSIAGYSYSPIVRTSLEEKANEYIQNKAKESGTTTIKSPMPGLIVKILKNNGEDVQIGEPIILLEAMKMENEIRATATGKIKLIHTKENNSVEKGELLLEIE